MPALVTRQGVPIAKVGVWNASTGVWDCTREQLADAVSASHDPEFRAPVLKLGHVDARFNRDDDGQPAVGRLENLTLTDDGNTLLCDLVGVPAWLDEIMASAYPSRSIEALIGVTTAAGREYAMVVTGLALLGVTAPAIESLGDIADLYGTTTTLDTWVAASTVAASALPAEDTTMPTTQLPLRLGQIAASASLDDLTDAFEDWAETLPIFGHDAWVRDLYTDHLIATVWTGDKPKFYSVPWTEANGVFSFGDPVEVRPTYEPVPAEPTAPDVAATRTPDTSSTSRRDPVIHWTAKTVRSAQGRGTADHDGSLKESFTVPIPASLAERLGIPADSSDEAAVAAVDALVKQDKPADDTADTDGGAVDTPADDTKPDAPTGGSDIDALVAAAVEKATSQILARLNDVSGELAASKATEAAKTKDRVLAAALTSGKIKPADRERWAKDYDAAPAVVTSILDNLAPGTAVPVAAAGHAGDVDTDTDDWSKVSGLLGLHPVGSDS